MFKKSNIMKMLLLAPGWLMDSFSLNGRGTGPHTIAVVVLFDFSRIWLF